MQAADNSHGQFPPEFGQSHPQGAERGCPEFDQDIDQYSVVLAPHPAITGITDDAAGQGRIVSALKDIAQEQHPQQQAQHQDGRDGPYEMFCGSSGGTAVKISLSHGGILRKMNPNVNGPRPLLGWGEKFPP